MIVVQQARLVGQLENQRGVLLHVRWPIVAKERRHDGFDERLDRLRSYFELRANELASTFAEHGRVEQVSYTRRVRKVPRQQGGLSTDQPSTRQPDWKRSKLFVDGFVSLLADIEISKNVVQVLEIFRFEADAAVGNVGKGFVLRQFRKVRHYARQVQCCEEAQHLRRSTQTSRRDGESREQFRDARAVEGRWRSVRLAGGDAVQILTDDCRQRLEPLNGARHRRTLRALLRQQIIQHHPQRLVEGFYSFRSHLRLSGLQRRQAALDEIQQPIKRQDLGAKLNHGIPMGLQ